MLNTGGKYDSKAFKKSVGLNGVGVKAVNALSTHFEVASYRDGKVRKATFERGILQTDVTLPEYICWEHWLLIASFRRNHA